MDKLDALATEATVRGGSDEKGERKKAGASPSNGKDPSVDHDDYGLDREGDDDNNLEEEEREYDKGALAGQPATAARINIRWSKVKRVLFRNGVRKTTYPFLSARDQRDEELIKQVLEVKPYAASHGRKAELWNAVAVNLSSIVDKNTDTLLFGAEVSDRAIKDRFLKILETVSSMSETDRDEQPNSDLWVKCKDMVYRYEEWASKEGKTAFYLKKKEKEASPEIEILSPNKMPPPPVIAPPKVTPAAPPHVPATTPIAPRMGYIPMAYQNSAFIPNRPVAGKSPAGAAAVVPYLSNNNNIEAGLLNMISHGKEMIAMNNELESERLKRKRKRQELEERRLALEREQFEEQRKQQAHERRQDELDRAESRKAQSAHSDMIMKVFTMMERYLQKNLHG